MYMYSCTHTHWILIKTVSQQLGQHLRLRTSQQVAPETLGCNRADGERFVERFIRWH